MFVFISAKYKKTFCLFAAIPFDPIISRRLESVYNVGRIGTATMVLIRISIWLLVFSRVRPY